MLLRDTTMEVHSSMKFLRQSSCNYCTWRTSTFFRRCFLLMLSIMYLVRPSGSVPQQLDVTYNLVEEQDSSGALLGNLLEEKIITDTFTAEQLQDAYFQFLSDVPSFISLSELTGVLSLSESVDRDTLCPNQDICQVEFDLAIQPIQPFTLIKVTILIEDVNDNDPVFDGPSFVKILPESTQPGSSFVLLPVNDPDSPAFSVDLVELHPNSGQFELRSTQKPDGTQELRLVLKTTLDRETIPEYQLQVIATDGGNPPRSGSLDINIVVSDANDNHPIFDQDTYEVNLPENSPEGTPVVQVNAEDLDTGLNGHIVYSLSADTASSFGNIFTVHNQTGQVSVIGNVDFETTATLFLTIEARDRGADPIPGETVVVIHVKDVNDHTPEILIHTLGGPGVEEAEVFEGTETGTFVARVVVSDEDQGDNGRYDCSLQEQHFLLAPLGNDFLITTQGDLDREVESQYRLAVVCRDHGSIPLSATSYITVNINDINDNSPMFSQSTYFKQIMENNDLGAVLLQLFATDLDAGVNAELVYSIRSPGMTDKFRVDPVTGVVSATAVLDREDESRYELVISVHDNGETQKSASATLVVSVLDQNDKAPVFNQDIYTYGIYENEPVGSEIGFVQADDEDDVPFNGFTYSLQSIEMGITDGPFRIAPNSGRITTNQQLDRELQSVYEIIALAVDRSEPHFTSSTTVSVYIMDRNDNPPRFRFPTEYNNTVYIENTASLGHVFTRVLAEDTDLDMNGRIMYDIVYSSQEGLFSVDPYHGTVAVNADISNMENRTFTLTVVATDSGQEPMSTSTNLNIIVNRTLALGAGSQEEIGPNVIIVVSVACISGVIIVALILAIVIMLRKQRLNRQREYRHKTRMEAVKVMTAAESKVVKVTVPRPEYTDRVHTQNEYQQRHRTTRPNGSGPNSVARDVPMNQTSTDVYAVPQKTKVDLSLEKSMQWLEALEAHSQNDPEVGMSSAPASPTKANPDVSRTPPRPAGPNISGTSSDMARAIPPLKSCLKNPLRLSTRKESAGDNDSVNSGVVSNTDSGRGASEQDDMCSRDVAFSPGGPLARSSYRTKDIPSSLFYKGIQGSETHDLHKKAPISTQDSIHLGPNKAYLSDYLQNDNAHFSSSDTKRHSMQSFGKDTSAAIVPGVHRHSAVYPTAHSLALNSQYPSPYSKSQTNTPNGHNSGNYPLDTTRDITNMSSQQIYSLADVSDILGKSKDSTLGSARQRNSCSLADDDGSSTSGSYVVDAQELVQQIDDIFFRDIEV